MVVPVGPEEVVLERASEPILVAEGEVSTEHVLNVDPAVLGVEG